jgi:hypothetical protein
MRPQRERGRDGGDRAAHDDPNSLNFTVRLTAAIGRMAVCGLLPVRLAERLIRWVRSA